MRLLLLPSYEYPLVPADSSYTLLRSFVENALDADPNLFVYWVIPEITPRRKMYQWKGVDQLWQHPRVQYHQVPILKGRDLNEMLFGEDLFELINPYNGKLCYWDAILTNNAGKAAHVARMIEYLGRPRPPVFIWEFSPKLARFSENLNESDMGIMSNYVANSNDNCYTLFQSEWCKKQLCKSAREMFSSTIVRKIQERSMVFTGAVDFTRLDRVAASLNGKKYEKPTLYFGGRFTTQKRGEFIAEIYDYAFCLGNAIDVVITTPSAKNQKIGNTKKEAVEIKIHEGLTQEQAWEVMLQSHIVICAQKHFGFLPSAALEQIASGLIVLVYDNHVDTTLGPEGTYPFLYKDKAHALAMLKEIVTDIPAAQKKLKPFSDYVRETYDLKRQVPPLLQWMKKIAREDHEHLFPKKIYKRDLWTEMATEVSKLPDRSWDKVFAFSAEKIPSLTATNDMPLMPGLRRTHFQLYKHLAARLGDDYSQALPTFGNQVHSQTGCADADTDTADTPIE
jgi:hypothetical protein